MVGIAGIVEKITHPVNPASQRSNTHFLEQDAEQYLYSEQNESFHLALRQKHSTESEAKNLAFPYFETEDKQFVCGLVGGVFNRKELRDRLISLGCVFQSMHDAELIIYLYKQYGILNLEKLEGSFALFLLDRKANKLMLARDPNGTKPLYYAQTSDAFAFSSTIAPLTSIPFVEEKNQINWKQIASFLRYGSLAVQEDFFNGIHTFPAGHYALIDLYSLQFYIRSFASSYLQAPILPENLDDNLKKQIDTLTDGLLKQQVKEIQTGLILDGSAASVSLASIIQKNSSTKLKTYSIKGLPGNSYNYKFNSPEKFADILKTKHKEIDLDKVDALSLLNEWLSFSATPAADVSGLIQLALAKEIHQDTQLIWNSTGADYLYNSAAIHKKMESLWSLFPKLPRFLLPLAYKWYNLNPKLQLEDKAKRNEAELFLALHEIFNIDEINNLFNFSISKGQEIGELDWNEQNHTVQLIQNYIPKRQTDSIEHPFLHLGMENRNAFILNKLIQPILNSPSSVFKRTEKTFIEELASKQLAQTFPFSNQLDDAPLLLVKWLKNNWKSLIEQFLDTQLLAKQGFFNIEAVEKIKKQFFSSPKQKYAQRLWLILQTQIWINNWVKNPNPPL